MRALITNDDGIDSLGLQELARCIEAEGFDVTVIAPSYDASGTGASLGHISKDRPIGFKEVVVPGLKGQAIALDGPPALCAITGYLEAFGPKPDIIVSGPNLGLNTGRSVLHSGTVGAALAAQNFGMKGLAVSLAVSDPWHFDTACKYTLKVIHHVVEGPPRCALNLNVPALPFDETKGLKWGGLAEFGSVRSQIIQQDNNSLCFDLVETEYQPPEDSDLGLVNAGFAAITALQSNAEVWNEGVQPGLAFSEAQPLPSASTNAAVTAPSHYRA